MPPKVDRKNPPCGQLFYFNCGNEVALVHQRSVSYTPPRIVRQMRRDLAYLPAWIAPNPEQDWVWLPCNTPRFSKEFPFSLAHVFGAEEVELGRTIHHPLRLSLWGPEPTLRPLFSQFRSGFPLLDIPESYSRPYPSELYDRSLSMELLQKLPVPLKLYPDFVIPTRSWRRFVLRWLLGLFWQSSLFLLRGGGCCLTSYPCPKRAVVPLWLRGKKMG